MTSTLEFKACALRPIWSHEFMGTESESIAYMEVGKKRELGAGNYSA